MLSLRSFLSSLDRLSVLPEEHLLACLQAALADMQRGLTALLQATRRKQQQQQVQQQQQQWALQQQQQQPMQHLAGVEQDQPGEVILLGTGAANAGGVGVGLSEARGMRGSTEALEGLQGEGRGSTSDTADPTAEQDGVMGEEEEEEEEVGGDGSEGASGGGGLAQEGWLEDAEVAEAQVRGGCESPCGD